MSFNTVLKGLTKIGETSGRTAKEEIFNNLLEKDGVRLKEVLNYALNPFLVYGVTVEDESKWAEPEFDNDQSNAMWTSFKIVLDSLSKRKITGDRARAAVNAQLKAVGPTYSFWLSRILNKDLKIGLAGKTVAKHIPGFLPKLSPMLCDVLDLQPNCNYKDWFCEPKLDGVRAIVVVEDGNVTVQSRSGKTYSNYEHIVEEVKRIGVNNAVFDGEFAAKTFKLTMQILTSKFDRKDKTEVSFHIFDVIPLADWKEQESRLPLEERKLGLKNICAYAKASRCEFLKFVVSKRLLKGSAAEVQEMCDYFVDLGYEGIVIKKHTSVYEWKRTKTWLKFKPFFECDLRIVGIEEGQGERKGRCGALICSGTAKFRNKTYRIKDTEVGAGLSEKQTKDFWIKYAKGTPVRLPNGTRVFWILNGEHVEIRFQEVSDWDVEKKTYKLKFARLRRMRPDKD